MERIPAFILRLIGHMQAVKMHFGLDSISNRLQSIQIHMVCVCVCVSSTCELTVTLLQMETLMKKNILCLSQIEIKGIK